MTAAHPARLTVAALAAAALAGSADAAAQPTSWIISVRHEYSGAGCRTICPLSDLRVQSDGSVKFRVRRFPQNRWKIVRSRASPEQLQKVWGVYASVRPNGLRGPVGNCDPRSLIIDWDILWVDEAGRSRLLACYDAEDARFAFYRGLRILRIDPGTGKRLTALQADHP